MEATISLSACDVMSSLTFLTGLYYFILRKYYRHVSLPLRIVTNMSRIILETVLLDIYLLFILQSVKALETPLATNPELTLVPDPVHKDSG